jgi:PST family polysaccharide transporter
MFRTGAYYGFAQLLTFVQSNIATMLIGARLGAVPLGYYNRAYQLLTVPTGRLLDPLTQVVVTFMNREAEQGKDRDHALLRIQLAVGVSVGWCFATAAAMASILIPMVLGPRWSEVVPVFQVLAVGGCAWVLNHVSYWAFIVYGAARQLLHYNLVSKPIAIISLVIGVNYGIVGVAWGYAIAMFISWPLNLFWLGRTTPLHARRYAENGTSVLLCCLVAGVATAACSRALGGIPSFVAITVSALTSLVAILLAASLMRPTRSLLLDLSRSIGAPRSIVKGHNAQN